MGRTHRTQDMWTGLTDIENAHSMTKWKPANFTGDHFSRHSNFANSYISPDTKAASGQQNGNPL